MQTTEIFAVAALGVPEIITIVVLSIVTLGVSVPFLIKAYLDMKAEQAKWKVLMGIVPFSYKWTGPGTMPFEERTLIAKFNWAVQCIQKSRAQPELAAWVPSKLADTRIIVTSVDTWNTLSGQHVGGQSIPDHAIIQIGPSMKSLCHELMHVLEFKVYGDIDYQHLTWTERGFFAAQNAYEGTEGTPT